MKPLNLQIIIRVIVDPSLGSSPETDPNDAATQINIRKMQGIFPSCIDIGAVLLADRKPLADQIKKSTQALLFLDSPADKNALSKALALIVKYGSESPVFIGNRVGVHEANRLVDVLYVDEGEFGLKAADDYINVEVVLQYAGAMEAMF